jgi:glycosyltransferase involved in cell wall biosynthesis
LRSLVFVTQEVDPAHPALAATIPKIAALARRVDAVSVLAAGAVPGTLPSNCRVRTFGAATKASRGARFAAALSTELARRRPIGVVAHMCPIYAVLAAPLARPFHVPVLLWYTHWHASPTLRLAARVSSRILSVDRASFPLASERLRAIGHGIDLAQFSCAEPQRRDAGALRLLALGRYSPAKGLEMVLRGLRRAVDAGLDVHLLAHGPTLSPLERDHLAQLERLVGDLRLRDRVRLEGPVRREAVGALLARADALVNNMRAGAPDKVVYEAAASCVPVLASNPVFAGFLPDTLRFDRERPEELAEALIAFAALGSPERRELGGALRERVAREHSVDRWAEQVVAAAEAV